MRTVEHVVTHLILHALVREPGAPSRLMLRDAAAGPCAFGRAPVRAVREPQRYGFWVASRRTEESTRSRAGCASTWSTRPLDFTLALFTPSSPSACRPSPTRRSSRTAATWCSAHPRGRWRQPVGGLCSARCRRRRDRRWSEPLGLAPMWTSPRRDAAGRVDLASRRRGDERHLGFPARDAAGGACLCSPAAATGWWRCRRPRSWSPRSTASPTPSARPTTRDAVLERPTTTRTLLARPARRWCLEERAREVFESASERLTHCSAEETKIAPGFSAQPPRHPPAGTLSASARTETGVRAQRFAPARGALRPCHRHAGAVGRRTTSNACWTIGKD